jgi:hypothetical protein
MLTSWFSSQVLPAVISAASGAVFGALTAGWDKLSKRFLLSKLGPSLKTIFNVLDPILDASLEAWDGSDVEKVLRLVIETIEDGKLNASEVNQSVRLVSELWLPQIASEKTAKGLIGEKEMVLAAKIRNAVETKSLDAPDLLTTLKNLYMS